jgi:hypothetical protein
MLDDILYMERDLLATLTTLRALILDHDIFLLKGMVEPLDTHIRRATSTLKGLELINNDNKDEETYDKT